MSALDMTFHILNMQFRLDISLVNEFLLLLNFEVVFVLLFCRFVFRLSLILRQLFDFLVQIFFLFAEYFKFRLLAEFNSDVVRETLVAKLS